MTRRPILAVTFVSLFLGTLALAQQPDTPAPPPPPARAPRDPGQPHQMNYQRLITMDDMHSQLRIGPPGIWWKNPDIIQKLTITPDQQKRMDDIFQQSRLQLIDLKAAVEREEVTLEPMLAANPPDTNRVLSQIDRVAQARAELEKANAKMLLGIRTILTPDQWTKLQAEERGNRRMMFRDRQRPDAPPTPGGPGNPMPPQSQLTLPPLPPLDITSDVDGPIDLNHTN
jgi:Spy/CpxP family protein refolding chaperone